MARMSISAAMSSCSSGVTLESSCEVRKPSKKCRKGTRELRVAAWATRARSCASWTVAEESIAHPVERTDITSEWSPKMESACVARLRAATWITAGSSSPAILNMLGTISSSPCEAVKVVARVPFWRAPWRAPAAPASDCISTMSGTSPKRFGTPAAAQSSACSPIGEDGVMGYSEMTSERA